MEKTKHHSIEDDYAYPGESKNEIRIDNSPDKKLNSWMVSTIIVGIIAVVLTLFLVTGDSGLTGNVISADDAGKKIIEYLNSRVGGGVEYISNEDKGNLYEVTVKYQGQEIPVYITKDGKYFVQGAIPITASDTETPTDNEQNNEQNAPQELKKSDKPKVELFVMTHCPYGTQAEKGLIPVMEALGSKVDAKIRFVHYFMHGDKEEKETYQQVCIREEQADKYLAYLKCFLDASDSEKCLTTAKVDKTKLSKCISSKAKDYYKVDSDLSEKYGVQGSPTIVINGQEANSGRNPAAYLSTVCSAFNKAPSECEKKLDSANPSPGFGYGTAGSSANAAQCV